MFGSFAGAVAWRIRQGRDFVSDRSECESCGHKLAWYDLLPVLSWVLLRGKCRYCHKKIGSHMLLVELFTAATFWVSFVAWPYGLSSVLEISLFVLWLAIVVVMAILFVYDLRWKMLPTVVLWIFIGMSAVYFVIRTIMDVTALGQALLGLVFSMLPIAGFYGALSYFSKEKLVGAGDVKIGIAMGFLLSWPQALVALLLANLLGTVVVLGPLTAGRLKRSTKIPFGPFLLVSTVCALLWSEQLIGWYLSLINVAIM